MMLRVAALVVLASQAHALPPLSEVQRVNDGLRDVKIADDIRIHCDALSARMVQAWATLNGLKSHARSLGYSDEEIEDFTKSKKDRKRLEAEADAYMTARGVKRGQDATYCALGRAEIASGSQIGTLLRER